MEGYWFHIQKWNVFTLQNRNVQQWQWIKSLDEELIYIPFFAQEEMELY